MIELPIRRLLARPLLAACCALAACSSSNIESDDMSERQLLDEARTSFVASDWDTTIDRAESLLERTKDTKRVQEALYLAGEARFQEQSWKKAFTHFQTLLHDYPYSSFVPKIEPHVWDIGDEYLNKRSAWPIFHDLFSGRERGVEVMREYASSYPSSPRAADALNCIARYRYERKEYPDAVEFYRRIVKSYPDSEWVDLAAFRIGECNQLASRGPEYEQRPLQRAVQGYRAYLATRPHGERRPQAEANLKRVEEDLARGELARARLYVAREQDQGARLHFANVALAYPSTKAAEEARREIERRGWDLSVNSVDTLAPPPEEEQSP